MKEKEEKKTKKKKNREKTFFRVITWLQLI